MVCDMVAYADTDSNYAVYVTSSTPLTSWHLTLIFIQSLNFCKGKWLCISEVMEHLLSEHYVSF